VLLLAGGCSLAARDHACWAYLKRAYRGEVPASVVGTLARERDTKRSAGRYKAAIGWYFRPRVGGTADPSDVRMWVEDYELARCPAAPATALPARR
jgi:hypothetical protein